MNIHIFIFVWTEAFKPLETMCLNTRLPSHMTVYWGIINHFLKWLHNFSIPIIDSRRFKFLQFLLLFHFFQNYNDLSGCEVVLIVFLMCISLKIKDIKCFPWLTGHLQTHVHVFEYTFFHINFSMLKTLCVCRTIFSLLRSSLCNLILSFLGVQMKIKWVELHPWRKLNSNLVEKNISQ